MSVIPEIGPGYAALFLIGAALLPPLFRSPGRSAHCCCIFARSVRLSAWSYVRRTAFRFVVCQLQFDPVS